MSKVLVSFTIAAYNRRDVLLRTIAQLDRCGLRRDEFEIIVVDNASTDGTADAVAARFPHVNLIRSRANRGSCAKNFAVRQSRGEFIVFLDDDSYPTGDSIRKMIGKFSDDPRLGAAGFTVILPDGSRECSAYPNVFIGCGVGFRRDALASAGLLPDDFFMQAEEYDLSLRLLDAGWKVETFDDLHVAHLKTQDARVSTRTTRLDVRNNLLLILRRFPDAYVLPYTIDWLSRYWKIARSKRHDVPFFCGLLQGVFEALRNNARQPVSDAAFEQFAQIEAIERRMRGLSRSQPLQRVLFIDLGKNALPYWRAAKRLGIEVVAIADRNLGDRGWTYHDIDVVSDLVAIKRIARRPVDAIIISNSSPVHADHRASQWAAHCPGVPVIDLLDSPKAAHPVPVRLAA